MLPSRTSFPLLLMATALTACDPPAATQTCNLASLSVTGPTVVMVRQTITLTRTPTQNAGSRCTDVQLTLGAWISGTPAVATVSLSGVVTGVAPGLSRISHELLSQTAFLDVQVDPTPVATVSVTPASPSLTVSQTQQMLSVCRDAASFVTPCPLTTWSMPSNSVASVSATGLVTALSVGTVAVTATVGASTGQTTVTVTGAAAPARLAYALAEQPTAASYTPDANYQFNGLGGAITVTRSNVGVYAVTIPGFGGAAGTSRIAIAGAVGTAANTCLVISATMIGVMDAVVNVECSNSAAARVDAPFTILAMGEAAFPGRFAFGHVASLPPAGAGATITLPTDDSWSSATLPVQLARDGIIAAGRFELRLRLPVGTSDVPILASAGTTGARCTIAGWGSIQDVVCYAPGGTSMADARFSGAFLDQGRSGFRLGSVWANDPSTASYSAPTNGFRNSAGGAATIARSATGTYTVTFQNLGRAAGRKETVVVTTHELLSQSSCRVSSAWSTAVSANFSVSVVCHDRLGALKDQAFILMVIE